VADYQMEKVGGILGLVSNYLYKYMTYIDKILEEFDEKFVEYEICDNPDHIGLHSGLYGTDNKRLGCPCCGSDEEYRIKSTARISKKPEELKSFFATSIDQAVAEERERVVNTPHPMLPDINKVKEEALLKNNTVDYKLGFLHGAEAMRTAIISLKNKEI